MKQDARARFEARVRVGAPLVRAAACRWWSELSCTHELEDLLEVGSRVLVQSATQAADENEFLERLHHELRPALRQWTMMRDPGREIER